MWKNEGSTARDHRANERTFLAWMRTGLGIAAFGVALDRVRHLMETMQTTLPAFSSTVDGKQISVPSKVQPKLFIGMGLGCIGFGALRVLYASTESHAN